MKNVGKVPGKNPHPSPILLKLQAIKKRCFMTDAFPGFLLTLLDKILIWRLLAAYKFWLLQEILKALFMLLLPFILTLIAVNLKL